MAANNEKLTPAMRQFHQFKKTHPDCILFFRMGDFYETFYDDAKTCSKVCGLALTSRSKGEKARVSASFLCVKAPVVILPTQPGFQWAGYEKGAG